MQVIVDRIRATLPAVNEDILGYITGASLVTRRSIGIRFVACVCRYSRDEQGRLHRLSRGRRRPETHLRGGGLRRPRTGSHH